MARYTGPVCKLCRREGEKLFLKGERCFSPKCAIERRSYPPGEHGREALYRRRRESDYSRQLRAKQKARRVYALTERQFRRYYRRALHQRGKTGEALLGLLERRLDNVIYRLGYAESRDQARQMVSHGHYNVNGRRTDIPSMIVRPGDEIRVRAGSRRKTFFKEIRPFAETKPVPGWLERDLDDLSARVVKAPERQDIDANIDEQLIIEFYSR